MVDEDFFAALLVDDPQRLYDRAPCGYLTTSRDGVIRKVNHTFLTLSGYTEDDLVDVRRFADLLTIGGRIYYETHFAPLLTMGGVAREIAFDLLHRDGGRIPVLVNAVVDRDEAGGVALVRIAVFDATHRRAYERELLTAKQRAETAEAHAQALARTLQQTFIPPLPPEIPGLEVAAAYRPAGDGTEVGGDFYDVFEVAADEWVLAVGDVRGKGAAAAIVTALVRHTLRAASMGRSGSADTLRRLNEVMVHFGTDRHATVVLVRLRRRGRSWQCTVSCGGHPLPFLRGADGSTRTVGEPGALLGLLEEPGLDDRIIGLTEGDTLLLYTDGVTEARRGDGFYGDSGLEAVVRLQHHTAQDLVTAVLDDVLRYQSGDPRDDIALLAVRIPGPLPAAGGGAERDALPT